MEKETFKLIKLLGSGAFGLTYAVEVLDAKNREKWGKEVAIKIPKNKKIEKILISELIVNASLDHSLGNIEAPNIIRYLGFDLYDDKYVMVMEYVKGYSLRRKLENEKISIEKALSITKQVCKGLSELHKAHLLHRDIKPENIMLCEKTETVKIGDFGISKWIKSTELARTGTGTIPYMPKEILRGSGGSYYSDIYSTGVTLYEMLTDQLPFGDVEMCVEDLIDCICNQKPISPRSVNSAIDEKLNAIILKSIEKDINKRYQSAEEFLHAIECYERGYDVDEIIIERTDKKEETIDKLISDAKQLSDRGQACEAEKKYKEILEKYSKDPKAYISCGEFYNRCQRYPDAINVFEKAIKKNINHALIFKDLGFLYNQIGEKKKAAENLEKAIDLGVEPNLERQILKMLEKMTQVKDKKQRSTKLLKNNEEATKPVNQKQEKTLKEQIADSWEMFKTNKYNESEKMFLQLLKEFPDDSQIYLNIGDFYNRCQRYGDAVKILEKGIQINDRYALFYRNLSLALFQINDKKRAIENLKKAIKLGLEPSLEKHAVKLIEIWERK